MFVFSVIFQFGSLFHKQDVVIFFLPAMNISSLKNTTSPRQAIVFRDKKFGQRHANSSV